MGKLHRPRVSGWLKSACTAFAGKRMTYACDMREKTMRSMWAGEGNLLAIATVPDKIA